MWYPLYMCVCAYVLARVYPQTQNVHMCQLTVILCAYVCTDPCADILRSSDEDILKRTRLIENEAKSLKNESVRLTHEHSAIKEQIKENNDKIKLNKQLPYLVANVVEVCAGLTCPMN